MDFKKFLTVVILLTGLIGLLISQLLLPGSIESIIYGEIDSLKTDNKQLDNFNGSEKNHTAYNKNAIETLTYKNDADNFKVSELFYASESVEYMNITGIVLNVKTDGPGIVSTIYFSAGYNVTTVNAKFFPLYPGNVHSYTLKKVKMNDTFYYVVEDVKIISEKEFIELYKIALESNKTGTMEKLVDSLASFSDEYVNIAFNGSRIAYFGKVDSVEQMSADGISCVLKFKSGLNLAAINGCTYNYNYDTKLIIVTNKIKVREFTFFNIENIYSVEGQ